MLVSISILYTSIKSRQSLTRYFCSFFSSLPFIGDNVGDVAGMGADLFESFVGSIIAAATLANGDATLVALPFWIAGAGIVASVIGFFAVGTKDGASQKQLLFALHKGVILSSIFVLGFSAIIISQLFDHDKTAGWKLFACIAIGLVAGILIGQATEYYTSYRYVCSFIFSRFTYI